MTDLLVHALAGSFGGAAAMAVTYPLEQIRTLMQLRNDGSKPEHRSLYQGCWAVIQTVAISNFIYFYSLQYSKHFIVTRMSIPLSPVPLALSSSSLAAAVNIVATEPLWKANTLLKTLPATEARNRNIFSIILKIVREEGLASLWSGTAVSMWLISNPIIQFSIYEYIKAEYAKKKRPFSSMNAFIYGAFSKALATIFTYPLQVAQTRLRVMIPSDKNSKENMISVLVQLYKEKALFKGCQAKLAQNVLTAAFMFAFYERISQIIFSLLKNRSRK